jgi:small subunit ribosomal protein S6
MGGARVAHTTCMDPGEVLWCPHINVERDRTNFTIPRFALGQSVSPFPVQIMQTYELLYLTGLQESDEQRTTIRDLVADVITSAGGSVVTTREFAKQRLAYPVDRHQAGEYMVIEFTAPEDAVAVVRRELQLKGELLRTMLTVKNTKIRPAGVDLEAQERARTARLAEAKVAQAPVTKEKKIAVTAEVSPQPIEDLDRRLEEILGKEMV